jgi:hypothetical protein
MKPLLDAARKWDIATNPRPQALFEAGSAGFQIWCTPEDNPGGVWDEVAGKMTVGAFSKPCAYVGGCFWEWKDELIVGIKLVTDAYLLRDCWLEGIIKYEGSRFFDTPGVHNHVQEIGWCINKVRWLWYKAYGNIDSLLPIFHAKIDKNELLINYKKAFVYHHGYEPKIEVKGSWLYIENRYSAWRLSDLPRMAASLWSGPSLRETLGED